MELIIRKDGLRQIAMTERDFQTLQNIVETFSIEQEGRISLDQENVIGWIMDDTGEAWMYENSAEIYDKVEAFVDEIMSEHKGVQNYSAKIVMNVLMDAMDNERSKLQEYEENSPFKEPTAAE